MRIADACRPVVVTAAPNATVAELARLMRNPHVGSVVIVDPARKPIGIVTDRDIVVEMVACGLDARTLTAGEVMSASPTVIAQEEDTSWALKVMRDRGVRRLPVVDASGVLAGIVALDDLLEASATALYDVVQAIGTERLLETQRRRVAA